MAEGPLITDELKKMIGVPSEPVIFKIEEGAMQSYTAAIVDPNPLFNDAFITGQVLNVSSGMYM